MSFPELQPMRNRLAESNRACPVCKVDMNCREFIPQTLGEQVWVTWQCPLCDKVLRLRYAYSADWKHIEVTER